MHICSHFPVKICQVDSSDGFGIFFFPSEPQLSQLTDNFKWMQQEKEGAAVPLIIKRTQKDWGEEAEEGINCLFCIHKHRYYLGK